MKLSIVTAAVLTTLISFSASADLPGRHPGYLHALSDLRDARWNLQHRPGDVGVSEQEDIAIGEIDHAIGEIKKAAIEDGKNLDNHPQDDAHLDHPGRLHHALDLLRKAHNDLSGEEDNPETRDLKHRSLDNVDAAIRATEHAVHDVVR
jgi:hypothetical protein